MKGALLVTGIYMLGFMLPELAVLVRPGVRVSISMNFWCATACSLIAVALMI